MDHVALADFAELSPPELILLQPVRQLLDSGWIGFDTDFLGILLRSSAMA